MSATMARQGGRVQLEECDMCMALNKAKMARGGFLRAAMEDTQFLIKIPWVEVLLEKKRVVEIGGPKNGKAAMEIHPAMLRENQADGWLPCQDGTAQNPQTRWRGEGTGAPAPERLWRPTPEPAPHPPETPPVPPGNNEAAHLSEIEGVPPGYVYIHTPLPSAQ